MPATVTVNLRTVVHASSNGIATAFPDVCKTPTPGGPVPIPYPNISKSQDTSQGSSTVKMDGNPIMLKDSKFSMSTGDEAGSAGGNILTNQIKGPAAFLMFSFDVKVEGKPVPRQFDIMMHNMSQISGTPPFPCVQPGMGLPLISPDQEKKGQVIQIKWSK